MTSKDEPGKGERDSKGGTALRCPEDDEPKGILRRIEGVRWSQIEKGSSLTGSPQGSGPKWPKTSGRMKHLLLALTALFPVLLASYYLTPRALPWWVDAGNWLKYMHAILGNNWPMWGVSPFTYPPLYFLILAALSSVLGDEILALKVSSLLLFASLPISAYVLTRVLFSREEVALAAAWLMSLTPVATEMLGWGGYPNLLGLALLPLAFTGVILSMRHTETKWVAVMLVTCALLGLSHILAALVFCFSLVILFGLRLAARNWQRQWVLVLGCIATTLPIAVLQVASATGPGYITSNVMALQRLQVQLTSGIVMWMFRDPIFFGLMWTSAVMGVSLVLSRGKRNTEALMMISWFLSPVILSQLSFLGVALDFQRIFFHVFQPFTILAATPLLELSAHGNLSLSTILDLRPFDFVNRNLRSIGECMLKALPMLLVLMSVLCLPLSSLVGFTALSNVNSWYNGVDPYGDKEKLDLVHFVVANTLPTDVFVAEDSIARWLEGYAQRRVIMHHPPMYLFMAGEIQREYVARAILLSTRGIRTQSAWILDQFPYGCMSPIVQLYMKGDYESVLYLDENASYVVCINSNNGSEYRLYLKDFTSKTGEIVSDSGQFSLVARYDQGPISIVRTATAAANVPGVQLSFVAQSTQRSCRLVELVVNMSKCGELVYYETWREPSNGLNTPSFRVVTDMGDFYIHSTSGIAFPFIFCPMPDGQIVGTMTMWSLESSQTEVGQVVYESKNLLMQTNVKYVVIPLQSRITDLENVEARPVSLPEYNHLLRDPLFKIAYLNRRIALLSVCLGS